MGAALTADDVIESLSAAGWRGFSLLRRYITEHPGDSRALARRVASIAWEARGDLGARQVRFAFLSDGSTVSLDDALWLECLTRGVVPATYHALPGQISREVLNPDSGLWAHAPDVIVVAVSPTRDARGGDLVLAEAGSSSEDAMVESLLQTLRRIRERSNAWLLVHNLMAPEFRPLGLHDLRKTNGLAERYARLNLALAESCRDVPGAHVVDLAPLIALSGARVWSLHKTWFLAAVAFPEDLAVLLCREYAAVGAALRGLTRKCLAVDLDGTLWGGVAGELGAGGVQIGRGYPGNLYKQLQETIRELRAGGVILAINSHNDEEDAWQPFERRAEMVLKREDFAAYRINWQDKVANLRGLSDELRISLDAFVVLDNDPVERSWIEEQLPEVHVLAAQDPLEMLRTLSVSRLFQGLERTSADELRAVSYAVATSRRDEERSAVSREAFLAELELVVTVGSASQEQLPRLAQLTQRTNQFNLTTRRYTQAELAELHAAPDFELLYCACRDRFADEGVTGLVILRKAGLEWSVDTLLLSCRVLGWGVERALAGAVCDFAARHGATTLTAEYVRTARNGQTEWFYRELGFAAVSVSEARSSWRLALPPARNPAPAWIDLRLARGAQ